MGADPNAHTTQTYDPTTNTLITTTVDPATGAALPWVNLCDLVWGHLDDHMHSLAGGGHQHLFPNVNTAGSWQLLSKQAGVVKINGQL